MPPFLAPLFELLLLVLPGLAAVAAGMFSGAWRITRGRAVWVLALLAGLALGALLIVEYSDPLADHGPVVSAVLAAGVLTACFAVGVALVLLFGASEKLAERFSLFEMLFLGIAALVVTATIGYMLSYLDVTDLDEVPAQPAVAVAVPGAGGMRMIAGVRVRGMRCRDDPIVTLALYPLNAGGQRASLPGETLVVVVRDPEGGLRAVDQSHRDALIVPRRGDGRLKAVAGVVGNVFERRGGRELMAVFPAAAVAVGQPLKVRFAASWLVRRNPTSCYVRVPTWTGPDGRAPGTEGVLTRSWAVADVPPDGGFQIDADATTPAPWMTRGRAALFPCRAPHFRDGCAPRPVMRELDADDERELRFILTGAFLGLGAAMLYDALRRLLRPASGSASATSRR